MDQISQHINIKNHKICSYDQLIKMIVNSGCRKGDRNDSSSPKVTDIHYSLLLSIVHTPEKCVSHGEVKSLTRKFRTSSLNYSY